VMYEGKISGLLERSEFSEDRVLTLAVGKSRQEIAAVKMVMGGE
jgi:ribose transport system ATP-binding protein